MKKIIAMAALVLASVATFAQQRQGTLSIQPKVGVSMANIADCSYDFDARFGIVAGAEATYQVADIVGISAGALYSQQGAKATLDKTDCTYKLDYINVPVMAHVYLVKGLAVNLGVQAGFNVADKLTLTNGKASATVNQKEYLLEAKPVVWSIPAGLSYEFCNVVVDARCNFGISKALKDIDGKTEAFYITVGYKFEL